MNIDSIPRMYREAWAAYEAFRKLGFKNDDIYPMISNSITHGKDVFHIVLEAQGKQFIFTIGKIDRPAEEVNEYWNKLIEAVCDMTLSDDTLHRMWKESFFGDKNNCKKLLIKISQKGFIIPLSFN